MASRTLIIALLIIFIGVASTIELTAFKLQDGISLSATHTAVSDAANALISSLGWSDDEARISHIDTVDAKFGQTLEYEFDIQLGEQVIPLRLSEEIPVWKYWDELPTEISETSDVSVLPAANQQIPDLAAVLAPFQVSGPVELWIQDAEQLRLSIPNDIEAGNLKKVLLADGAVVTVKGAREVSLAQPLQLPLPLPGISKDDGLAASLVALANRLRYASRAEEKPLLSLKIVGPTSMVASNGKDSDLRRNTLKLKRLASGAIKLEPHEQQEQVSVSSGRDLLTLLKSEGEEPLWPLPSLVGSDSRLIELERALLSAMGPSVYEKGSFNLLRAQVSAATLVSVEFQLEKKLFEDSFPSDIWPEWRTKPSVERLEFEMMAKVEGQQLTPIRVQDVQEYTSVETSTWRALMGNVSYTKTPRIYLPPSYMTLNPNWDMMD